MKKIFFILACIFGLGITAEVFSQAGGFPSSPVFNTASINVGGTSTISCTSGTASFCAQGANSTATAGFVGSSTSGQSDGVFIDAGTTSADYSFVASNSGGTNLLRVYGDGGVTLGAPTGGDKGSGTMNALNGFYYNGVAVPKTVWGVITQGAGTCSVLGTVSSSGVTSCSFVSTGISSVTISGNFSSTPVCTSNVLGTNYGSYIGSNTTTNVQVGAYISTSGAGTNQQIELMCVGI